MGARKRPPTPRAGEPRLRLPSGLPPSDARRLAPLVGCARNLGIGVSGTRGVGKSQLLRLIAWLDFVTFRKPTIVIDPVGATIDGILSVIPYFRPADQAALWARIRHVDLTPTTHAVALPLLARFGIGRETPFDVAGRVPAAFARLDPSLKDASIEGFNVLWETATHGCAILAALGHQVSELPALLREPEAWRGAFAEARRRCPEVADAVTFFERDYLALKPEQRRTKTKSLLTKLTLFADPPTKAQFCAGRAGLDWTALRHERQLWLFDLRFEPPGETRQFKLLWLLLLVVDYVKRWGAAHGGDRRQPLSLIVDEVTALYAEGGASSRLLVADLDGLINRLSRNYDLHLTLSYQELFQLPAGLRQTLLSLGTQFFGRMTDWETAEFVARRYADFDPTLEKSREPLLRTWQGRVYAIGERVETYSRAEQRAMTQDRLARLPVFRYLASVTTAEGEPPRPLREFSIAPYAVRRFPPASHLAAVRAALSRRDGVPVDAVLREIAQRGPVGAAARPEPDDPTPSPADRPPPRTSRRAPARRPDGIATEDDPR
jgi:hypothetical protein